MKMHRDAWTRVAWNYYHMGVAAHSAKNDALATRLWKYKDAIEAALEKTKRANVTIDLDALIRAGKQGAVSE
jgi:hypothetical protein